MQQYSVRYKKTLHTTILFMQLSYLSTYLNYFFWWKNCLKNYFTESMQYTTVFLECSITKLIGKIWINRGDCIPERTFVLFVECFYSSKFHPTLQDCLLENCPCHFLLALCLCKHYIVLLTVAYRVVVTMYIINNVNVSFLLSCSENCPLKTLLSP